MAAIVNPADFLPTTPGQGLSVLFNAAQLAATNARTRRVVLDTFAIDCTLSETVEYEADVSEFEIEEGSNITDNRRTKPVEITIAGLVSDTPLDKSLVTEAIRLAAGPLNIALDAATFGRDFVKTADAVVTTQAFEQLRALYLAGSKGSADGTFAVATSYGVFERMVVKSLKFARDSKTGRALPFVVTLREIRTVQTAVTTIAGPALLQAPLNLGTKAPGNGSKYDPDELYRDHILPFLDAHGLPAAPKTH